MAARRNGSQQGKSVETLKHDEARRKNIPTAEYQSVIDRETENPLRAEFERRNPDLDPQLVWRGKDTEDWSDLVVQAPPLYIQEKVHPKVLVDDLLRQSRRNRPEPEGQQGAFADFFADFNGVPQGVDKTDFYKYDGNWTNRMILGDSLQVMASLAEREGLRGKVQCIYIDPPYGIKFNSNFQWSTTSRDVKDGNAAQITREPEQVKAFRDTWRDGIHSYLTYLRDRLTVARDLLADSGSIFVQIGDENVHRVRALLDEVFGERNFLGQIGFVKTSGFSGDYLSSTFDSLVWYGKDRGRTKYRQLFKQKAGPDFDTAHLYRPIESFSQISLGGHGEGRLVRLDQLTAQGAPSDPSKEGCSFQGVEWFPRSGMHWKTHAPGRRRLVVAGRVARTGKTLGYIRALDDFAVFPTDNVWQDTGTGSFTESKTYIVQTNSKVIERCVLMTTDPGDLVLDPTCGSGTTAFVAEQWGRRWITVDTSRVALALARARIMGARYPYYLLADSPEGQRKEAEVTRTAPSSQPTHGNIRHGFVYERVPHITLKSIANNAEIDVIWEEWEQKLLPLRLELARLVSSQEVEGSRPSGGTTPVIEEWDVPRARPDRWPAATEPLLADFWEARIARQKEIDASIAAKAEFEYLYDRPYQDGKKVRVAGPFTVESLSPHRILGVDEDDELINTLRETSAEYGEGQSFVQMILENLRTSGVQQAHKEDRIEFTSLVPWPGELVCAEGRYFEGEGTGPEKRAAVFVGPEFGTVSRPDLVKAAREAGDGGFDVLIACAFNYDAHSADFKNLGRIPVLKARMNADLHMAADLKNTGKGNLFVIFGEPDIDILDAPDGQICVKVKGVDVFHPATGEVRSDGPEGIACWFIDTDYNEESFFVRHAYFLGANDPYKSLKTTLKAEIDEDAWATLHSDTSRPFPKPESGRIAVKVINHLGDEVMKVFRV